VAKIEKPFSHTVQRIDAGAVRVEVQGYLDGESTRIYLASLARAIEPICKTAPVGIVFVDSLSGFAVGIVAKMHGEWFREMGNSILGVAIVSTKPSVRFGVVAAKLVTRHAIQVFPDEVAARDWLRQRASA
jgi:hypothetical protein